MRTAVLIVHAAAGAAGLVLGAAALMGHRRASPAFHHTMAIVCASAVVLAATDWAALWWFVPIAAGSYAFALSAHVADRHRGPNWMRTYVRGVGGAYISLWTALVVVSIPEVPIVWFLPTALGAVPIEVAAHRATTGAPAGTA